MAKDIRECLLEQVGKFHQWQEITYPGKPPRRLAVRGRSITLRGMIYLMPFAMC